MKQIMKRISALLLVLMLVLGLASTAFAAEPTVTFRSLEEGFEFQSGSRYTASDLFDGFKNVMPGDRLSETIRIKNEAADCDYIKLYLRTEVHDENGNPLTYSEAFENADGKDQENVDGRRDETVATMQEFLSKLTMRIYNGTELVQEFSPDQAGALADYVFLGALRSGESCALKVELDVPVGLDNRYANRVGEVDWVFLAEGIEYEKLTVHKVWDDNGCPDRPDSVTVRLLRDGEIRETAELNRENQWTYTWEDLDDRYNWTVEEEAVSGYETRYRTEDNIVFITNHRDYEPVPEPEPENLTVRKVWSDGNDKNGKRPDSVTVTLYNGDRAVDQVSLSDANHWTHTWENLDGNGDWSVLETGIPKGYTPAYRTQDGVVTVTNTASLIQTGQLNWPIYVLGGFGLLLLAWGIVGMSRKRKKGCV